MITQLFFNFIILILLFIYYSMAEVM